MEHLQEVDADDRIATRPQPESEPNSPSDQPSDLRLLEDDMDPLYRW
jgi:hypothetical protein